ncbi:predicted protein [Histoplasma capsulatum var. duboisii H88]|uniref:Predicted protein n=2 Tax=Ajellomyces capsulatus TaxID=5037 RepID=F0UUS0_AJEC8|nr:predicted protein [Histoplasma capsulatum H143]EGC49647.1 predicted protein [Histoplasma capsulatum var. duboisii H88]
MMKKLGSRGEAESATATAGPGNAGVALGGSWPSAMRLVETSAQRPNQRPPTVAAACRWLWLVSAVAGASYRGRLQRMTSSMQPTNYIQLVQLQRHWPSELDMNIGRSIQCP